MTFPEHARVALRDGVQRGNLARATSTIRDRRRAAIAELPDWAELRSAAAAIKDRVLADLDEELKRLEREVSSAGGTVHWARDAQEANEIVAAIVRATGERQVLKVKSMTTDEIGLNQALISSGITPIETDLAELIIQLGDDRQSHIVVPAIHRNRAEIQALFARRLPSAAGVSDDPRDLAEAARRHLRRLFMEARVAISGANFAVAETGTVCVVESEGNGRMCTTLPETLVTVMGVEKLLGAWDDLGVFLQLLPRSATGERMNPYTSLWTGVHQGDGPSDFHLILLDAGRTRVLADPIGRQALRCIRCAACLNVCPVYRRTGGHAYGSIYPGPIGAILAPQLDGLERHRTLPFASSLCGACEEVCPVAIDIPRVLVHLRSAVVESSPRFFGAEPIAMGALSATFASRRAYELAQRLGRVSARALATDGVIARLPGALSGWTSNRDLRVPAAQTFREWWRASGRVRTRRPRPARPARRRQSEGAHTLQPAHQRSPGRDRERARAVVLERVEGALRGRGGGTSVDAQEYRRSLGMSRNQLCELLAERLHDYGTSVHCTPAGDVAETVANICVREGAATIVVPVAFGPAWIPDRVEVVLDRGLKAKDLDRVDGALTGCALAIAETGTIALDASPSSGRRALSLVPDLHICVVEEDSIVGTVIEGVAALRGAALAGSPITLVSGPSATSDIELQRVQGVHGPRRLHVLITTS